MLAAMLGAGMACILANRRLNRLPVPVIARLLEAIFVGVLTLLRYDSLRIQGADLMGAAGGAALAAFISAVGLVGIEEVVVESHTLPIFVGELQVRYRRWRRARAAARLGRVQARLEAAGKKVRQAFLQFLVKEEVPLDESRRRAEALRSALVGSEGTGDA
jgi:hypothetical protein